MAGDRRILERDDIVAVIREFNAGRDPDRLAIKYRKMRSNAFAFMRGACHLFYPRLPIGDLLRDAPLTWACGDLHLENFGSYKGDAGQLCFDINDFDESVLAPCTLDLLRLLASLLVGAGPALGIDRSVAKGLCEIFIAAYVAALADGKVRRVEFESSEGMIRELFDRLQAHKKFLDDRTQLKDGKRSIRLDGKKAMPVSDEQRIQVEGFMREFAERQTNPGFYRPLDVARRIAGTGSLGVDRFVILVEGKGSSGGNELIDLKKARASSLLSWLETAQPAWQSEADRIVAIQRHMQAVPAAFLQATELGGEAYVLRALQPSEDRLELDEWCEFNRLEAAIRMLARVVAWDQMRSSGSDGVADKGALMDFARRKTWGIPLIEMACHCADQTEADWRQFAQAFDDGALQAGLPPGA